MEMIPHWRMTIRTPNWHPPMDVYETDEAIFVRIEIAGMREENFEIELVGQVLSIRGARADIAERRAFHQMEITFGEFACEIGLPGPVHLDQVEALYENGFLRIRLPKVQPRQIPVEDSNPE